MYLASLFRRRGESGPPPPADPATLIAFSGYWEQRGDGSDYGIAAPGQWNDRSGNGRHWTQTTPASRPLTGAPVDGKPRILLESTSYWGGKLDNANTLGTFGTAAQLAVSMMVRIPTITPGSGTWQNSPMLWADVSGWFGIFYGEDFGVNYIGVVACDTGWRVARVPYTVGSWVEVNAAHTGGNIMIELNAPPALDPGAGIRKSAACGNIGQTTHALRTGHGGIGTSSAYEVQSWAKRLTLSSSDYAALKAWRKYIYPAAALP